MPACFAVKESRFGRLYREPHPRRTRARERLARAAAVLARIPRPAKTGPKVEPVSPPRRSRPTLERLLPPPRPPGLPAGAHWSRESRCWLLPLKRPTFVTSVLFA